jgi:hypothetical protein
MHAELFRAVAFRGWTPAAQSLATRDTDGMAKRRATSLIITLVLNGSDQLHDPVTLPRRKTNCWTRHLVSLGVGLNVSVKTVQYLLGDEL